MGYRVPRRLHASFAGWRVAISLEYCGLIRLKRGAVLRKRNSEVGFGQEAHNDGKFERYKALVWLFLVLVECAVLIILRRTLLLFLLLLYAPF